MCQFWTSSPTTLSMRPKIANQLWSDSNSNVSKISYSDNGTKQGQGVGIRALFIIFALPTTCHYVCIVHLPLCLVPCTLYYVWYNCYTLVTITHSRSAGYILTPWSGYPACRQPEETVVMRVNKSNSIRQPEGKLAQMVLQPCLNH